MSYDYGTSFMLVSDRFRLSGAKEDRKQVIAQFYHSPADNKRVRHPNCSPRGTSVLLHKHARTQMHTHTHTPLPQLS